MFFELLPFFILCSLQVPETIGRFSEKKQKAAERRFQASSVGWAKWVSGLGKFMRMSGCLSEFENEREYIGVRILSDYSQEQEEIYYAFTEVWTQDSKKSNLKENILVSSSIFSRVSQKLCKKPPVLSPKHQ